MDQLRRAARTAEIAQRKTWTAAKATHGNTAKACARRREAAALEAPAANNNPYFELIFEQESILGIVVETGDGAKVEICNSLSFDGYQRDAVAVRVWGVRVYIPCTASTSPGASDVSSDAADTMYASLLLPLDPACDLFVESGDCVELTEASALFRGCDLSRRPLSVHLAFQRHKNIVRPLYKLEDAVVAAGARAARAFDQLTLAEAAAFSEAPSAFSADPTAPERRHEELRRAAAEAEEALRLAEERLRFAKATKLRCGGQPLDASVAAAQWTDASNVRFVPLRAAEESALEGGGRSRRKSEDRFCRAEGRALGSLCAPVVAVLEEGVRTAHEGWEGVDEGYWETETEMPSDDDSSSERDVGGGR